MIVILLVWTSAAVLAAGGLGFVLARASSLAERRAEELVDGRARPVSLHPVPLCVEHEVLQARRRAFASALKSRALSRLREDARSSSA